MRCVRLNDAIFEGAVFDENTKWSKGFNPIEKGAIKVLIERE